MIRLVSGDLTLWEDGPSACGRTYPRLPHGIFGRIDDSFTVRGENVYPSEIDAALNEIVNYGGEHRIIISRDGAMDELLVQIEGTSEVYDGDPAAITALRDTTAQSLHRVLGIRTRVEVVMRDTFARTDFKARRVIDDREVFREMRRRLEDGET